MTRTFLINLIVALLAAALGFALYHYYYAARTAPAPVQIGPQPLAVEQPATATVDVLPDFSLRDRNGNPVSIRSWPGKSLIINFWATWCAPCRKEIPLLIATNKAHAADGFQVVGIAVDEREAVLKYAEEINLDYPLLIGEQDGLDALMSFGLAAAVFPVTAFTDRLGRIVAVYPGELTAKKLSVLLDAVKRVNRGEQSPAEARLAVARLLEQH